MLFLSFMVFTVRKQEGFVVIDCREKAGLAWVRRLVLVIVLDELLLHAWSFHRLLFV